MRSRERTLDLSVNRLYWAGVCLSEDKNHRDSSAPDDTVREGRIYGRPGYPWCPVLSYTSYLERIHPQLDDLWQRPRDSYDENEQIWYCRSPLAKKQVGKNDARYF